MISDLDGYPVELLASLPRWLRCHLLSSVPALDLCRLDHTTVAMGIDVNQLLMKPKGRLGSAHPEPKEPLPITHIPTD